MTAAKIRMRMVERRVGSGRDLCLEIVFGIYSRGKKSMRMKMIFFSESNDSD